MEKPNYDLHLIPVGQIFQICPEGLDPVEIEYGGDFLVGDKYEDAGVYGYLACVGHKPNLTRWKGFAYLRVKWKHLQFVGSCHWFRKKITEENGESDSDSSEE